MAGDAMNLMLATAAYNFKRAMNALLFVKNLILKSMIDYKVLFDFSVIFQGSDF